MKSKRVAFKWLPVAVAALLLCALVYYYTTHRRPVDNAKTATSTSVTAERRSRSTAAIVAYLSHIYTDRHWVRAQFVALSLLYSSFMLARFALSILKSSSNNQPNVSMFRTCLVSLATTAVVVIVIVVVVM